MASPLDPADLGPQKAIINTGDGYIGPRPTYTGGPVRIKAGGETVLETPPSVAASAVVSGLRGGAIAGHVFGKVLTSSGLVDQDTLEEMAQIANSEPYGKGIRFLTEFGAEFLMAGGALSLGRKALVKGLQTVVPKGMAALAAPTAQGGRMATRLGGVAARAMDRPGGSEELAKLGINYAVPKPGVERGAEILGRALGLGGLYGGGGGGGGGPRAAAARSGAFAAALIGVPELGITLGAKALSSGAREIDYGKLLARTELSQPSRAVTAQVMAELNAKTNAARQKLIAVQDSPTATTKRIAGAAKVEARTRTEALAFSNFASMTPLFRSYLLETPRARAGAIQTVLLKLAKTPDQMAGELGPAPAKMVNMAQMANLEVLTARGFHTAGLREIDKLARQGVGAWKAGGLTGRKQGGYLLKSLSAWQRTGNPITAQTTDAAALQRSFDKLMTMRDDLTNQLQQVGLEAPQGLRAGYGGMEQLPIVLNRIDATDDLLGKVLGRPKSEEQLTGELSKALQKVGYNQVDADSAAAKVVFGDAHRTPFLGINKQTRSGRTVWSMYDETSLNHLFSGKTFEEVMASGAPVIADPVVAMEVFANSVSRRVAYAKRFGPTGRVAREGMRKVAGAQGASLQLYDQMVEAVFGSSYGTVAEQAMMGAVSNAQTFSRMGLAWLPNMWQWLQTGILTGPGPVAKALYSRLRGSGPISTAAEASAINDSLIRGMRETFLDPYFRTPLGKMADSLLITTGLWAFERNNRLWAFHAGNHYAQKQLVKAVEGRLRGSTLDIARRRFQGMGQDLDSLVRRARGYRGRNAAEQAEALLLDNNMELMKNIGLGAVRQTQFLPDKTRLPTFWNTPTGKVAFQFKSFVLNQSRLMRDHVINEAAKGNMGPLLYVTAAFPVAGEVAQDLRALARRGELKRPNNPITRMVEKFAAVGGWAIAGDLYRAGTWGPEGILRMGAGPTVEDMAYLMHGILSRDFDRVVDRANKLPTYQAALTLGTLGLGIGMEGVPRLYDGLVYYLGAPEEGEGEGYSPVGEEAPTLQELQSQQR